MQFNIGPIYVRIEFNSVKSRVKKVLISEGRIPAIKKHRKLTNSSLFDSVQFVDKLK